MLERIFPSRSANDGEAIKAYVELAGGLGFELTAEQIVAEAANAAKELYARTEAAQSALENLDQEDLEMVAGGREPDCTSVHVYNCHSTHERWADWCWFSDYCSSMINIYA